VSNPDRVIDPSTGLKKIDLVRYYESVADWILPHLIDRPVSLVRGPSGIGGELFFQKHGEKLGIPGIRELDPALWPGASGAARDRERAGAGRRCADERDRAAHLELDREAHRQAGSGRLRPRSRRRGRLGPVAGSLRC
jgi:hypothetical protein